MFLKQSLILTFSAFCSVIVAEEFPGARIEYRNYGSCDPMVQSGCQPTGTRLDLINAKYDIARVMKMRYPGSQEESFEAYVFADGKLTSFDREGHKSTVPAPARMRAAIQLDPARNCAVGVLAPPDTPIPARNIKEEKFQGEKAVVLDTTANNGWTVTVWRLPERHCIEVRMVTSRPDAAGALQVNSVLQAESYKLGPVDSDPLWTPSGVETDPIEFRRLKIFREQKAMGRSDAEIEKTYNDFKNSAAVPLKAEYEAWKRLQAAPK